jgi:hypothetical protein
MNNHRRGILHAIVMLLMVGSPLLLPRASAQGFDPALFEQAGRLSEQVSLLNPLLAIRALDAAATTPSQHQEFFPRPIPMGVSISTTPSLPFVFAGTTGLLVRSTANPSIQMILSNSHVIGTIGPSLCPGTAPPGTWVLQPGTLDIGADPGNNLTWLAGVLAGSVPINFGGGFNLIDSSVAYTSPALAKAEIFGIGEPNPAFGVATLGMEVTKSGRTTAVTFGTVEAVNVTVLVNYGSGCGIALFTGQFSVTPGSFSSAGDSGSAILDSATNTPVGLLFAGSATRTLANHLFWVYTILRVFPEGTTAAALRQQMSSPLREDPRLPRIRGIQARAEARLLRTAGVIGVGIGRTEAGNDLALIIYRRKQTAGIGHEVLPSQVEGVPVRVIESEEFRAF